jgi:hypothetical protein
MLSLQESVTLFAQEHSHRPGDDASRRRGVNWLWRARRQGNWRRLLKRLARRPVGLHELSNDLENVQLKTRYAAGVHSVPIDRIRGSEGRSQDFDYDFYPLATHEEDRWIAVAAAVQAGISLPPVDLIQLGDLYYVRDGHHRVSVARALGQKAIDAQVTVWQA